MPAIDIQCEKCNKTFLAEGEWDEKEQDWLYALRCSPCEALIRQEVEAILALRGYPEPQ